MQKSLFINYFKFKYLFKCLIFSIFAMMIGGNAFAKKEEAMKMPPTVIETADVKTMPWQAIIQETGTLAAIDGIEIKPEIPGRVTDIYFESGQPVKKGDRLVQLFPDIIKADLAKAEAQLKLNQLNYERYETLYQKKFLEKAELDKAKATLESSEADVAKLKASLSQTLITAPFDGKIGLLTISIGDYLNVGEKITSLQSLDPIRVDFAVPEQYSHDIKIGDKIKLASKAFQNDFEGKVTALDAEINASTRSLNIQALVPNTEGKLIPGSFVEISLALEEEHSVLTIPQTAILYSPEGDGVYRVIDHKAVKTKIKLGEKLENNIAIVKEGLHEGDSIINGGLMKIQDQADVMTQAEAQAMFQKKK